MTMPQTGTPAPDFSLPRSGGGELSLRELRGRNVILFFYPKDDTPGCTKEACSFRDTNDDIEGANAVVLGVSPDSVQSHDTFAAKYNLPFVLLADTDHAVADAYGAWGERTMYGKTYLGIQRSTFLIDGNGVVARVWPNVKPDDHAREVLDALRELNAGASG